MDYHFRFAPRGGARVSVKEYRDWRSTGTAFRFGESNSGEIISIILHKTSYRMKPNLGGIFPNCWWDLNKKTIVGFEQLPRANLMAKFLAVIVHWALYTIPRL